jgi:predicted dehydrogenase
MQLSIRLKYVMDVNKELADKVAQQYGAIACYDLDTVIADPEVKAVVVSSATFAHYEQISKSIQAGKAVFTEKPISFNEKELASVIDLAVASSIPFFVGFQRRIDNNFKSAQQLVKAGKIGKVFLFFLSLCHTHSFSHSILTVSLFLSSLSSECFVRPLVTTPLLLSTTSPSAGVSSTT